MKRIAATPIYAWAFILATATCFGADSAPKQPVLVVLYSRFYDHGHLSMMDDRLKQLLPMLDRLHTKYPGSQVSALLQFSGAVSQGALEQNPSRHAVDKIQDYLHRGLIEVGYTGEEEPSYLNRPKANLLLTETPEERWKVKAGAAEQFLTQFRDPVSGLYVDGDSGGLARMQEIFGKASFISGANPGRMNMGGDSHVTHVVRRLNPAAIMVGIPPGDARRGIEGTFVSNTFFSQILSPEAQTSPEMYWQDEILRISDTSLADNKPHTTNEDPAALKTFFQGLDRQHVRVIKLEIGSYLRYLTARADGSVLYDPMEWMYYHPDDPKFPGSLKAFRDQSQIDAGFRQEEAFLNWLLADYFPANPGSGFVSVADLQKMAGPASGEELNPEQLKSLAADVESRYAALPQTVPNFARSGDRYFSTAESFELLAQALAVKDKTGSLPASVKLKPVYGPLEIPDNNMGTNAKGFTPAQVIHAAAALVPRLTDDTWKVVPDNAVPLTVAVGPTTVNAGQFLRLMAQCYLNPDPQKVYSVNAVQLMSEASFMYPKNTPMTAQGMGWTLKPARLRLDQAGHTPAGH